MPNRDQRARIASETIMITQTKTYTAPSGRTVLIGDAVEHAARETRTISPHDTQSLLRRAELQSAGRPLKTQLEVRNESTFAAARRLVATYGPERVAVLNFASAKNPGGGFLNGSQAQEESLARASALYACLQTQTAYYDANRGSASLLYTDHLIVSPRVPVFRDDADRLLEEPWQVTILTSPAPNAGAVRNNQPEAQDQIEPTFRRRIGRVLATAVVDGDDALVLGAWGCGVFANAPEMVARLFGEFLLTGGVFAHAFRHVVFAVLDRHGRTIAPFAESFGDGETAS